MTVHQSLMQLTMHFTSKDQQVLFIRQFQYQINNLFEITSYQLQQLLVD